MIPFLIALFSTVGFGAALANWHNARDPHRPEPGARAWFWCFTALTMGGNLLLCALWATGRSVVPYPHWTVLLLVGPWSAIAVLRAGLIVRSCQQRPAVTRPGRPSWANRTFNALILCGLLFALAGCECGGFDYTNPASGEQFHGWGLAFGTKKSIGKLAVNATPTTRSVELDDLQRSGDAEMAKAMMEGAVSGALKGVKP